MQPLVPLEISEFVDSSGRSPFRHWFDGLDIGPGYRVYFGVHERRVVILPGGGTKRRQQADIERARRIWRQLRPRNEIGGVRWH